MNEKEKLGLVQIFWGNGKGKTTSSLGTALRACGNGYCVHIVQFMKNGADSLEEQIPGEIRALEKFPNFTYKRFGMDGWVVKTPTENQIKSSKDALYHVKESLKDEKIDILIADEILYAVQLGLLSEDEIIELIDSKPKNKELILTGSHVPFPRIFEKAQLITEVRKIKHPYDKGILARKGIAFLSDVSFDFISYNKGIDVPWGDNEFHRFACCILYLSYVS
ncbi:cob(I)yrinic acid a,c-diamide adenosyltransferase [Candidatus Pacearchaeota archaeon]|nr:cob(I)yrinic acid a,c-diamide adenosyltransferase [Candidatus Pacearchaeota archaeon]